MPEMTLKWTLKSKKNCVFFEAASKLKNCVWTAPARADRGSDPPENLKKTIEKTIYEPTHLQTRFSSKKYLKRSRQNR